MSRGARLLAALAAGIGAMTLAGWYLGQPIMVRPFGSTAMQFNTALSLVLLGLAFLTDTAATRRIWPVVAPAMVAAGLGGAAILAYTGVWRSGIDGLGFALGVPQTMRPFAEAGLITTGRMAPHTAIALLLLSAGILISRRHARGSFIAAVHLGAVTMAIGVLGVFSYASGAEVPAGWAHVSRMALHTAMALVLLGAALVFRGSAALRAGDVVSHLYPVLALVAGVTLSLGTWQMLLDYSRAQVRDALQRQVSATTAQIEQEVEQRVRAIERLAVRAGRVGLSGIAPDVPLTRQDFSGIDAISWADTSSVVVGVEPRDTNRVLLGRRVLDDSIRAPALLTVLRTGRTAVTSPYEFIDRGRAALVVAPVGNAPLAGFLFGRLNLRELFDAVIADELTLDGATLIGALRVLDQRGNHIFATTTEEATSAALVERAVDIRNLVLRLQFWPSREWEAAMHPPAITLVLVVGCILSTALALVLLLRERGRAQERALAASEERLRLALEGANDGLFDWDIASGRMYYSPRWKEMLGYTDAELPNEFSTWSDRLHPDDREQALSVIARFRASDEAQYILEHRLRHKDGTYRWILARGLGIRDQSGALQRLIGSHADTTIRRTLEDSLHQRTVELQRSNEELERFAYAASHDLQEPLRMVISFTKLLERNYSAKLDDKAREYIAFAVDGATRMQVMINDLLQFSRVSTRGQPLKRVDAEIVFSQALRNLQVAIAEANAVVTHDPLPNVMADATQLLQLLQNLIGNGIKFRGREAPRVHVGCLLEGDRWHFTVKDNGIGFDQKYADRVFVIFQRLHARAEYPGNGIGLSICKRIVERHGGAIWVDTNPGKGSTFHFTLPVGQEQSHDDDRHEQRAA